MQVLFLSYTYWPPDYGGELLITLERFKWLTPDGFSFSVLTSGRPGYPSSQTEDDIYIQRSPIIGDSQLSHLIRRAFFLIWCFAKVSFSSYDILHIGSIGAVGPLSSAIAVWIVSGIARIRGISSVSVHSLADSGNETFVTKGFSGFIKRIYYANIRMIVSVSPALHSSVAITFPHKAYLIVNAVREDIFKPLSILEKNNFRDKYNITGEDIVFTFVGSVGKRKGFDLLATAFSHVLEIHPNWHLWVVGPISNSQNANLLTSEIGEVLTPLKGLEHNVRYWGRVDDHNLMARILSASNVFVFPTRLEGMPLTPMEAMASGIPLIVSRIPGVTDLANIENVTGLFTDVGNPASVEKAMFILGENRELRKSMGRAARARICVVFGWKRHIDEWANLYSKLGTN